MLPNGLEHAQNISSAEEVDFLQIEMDLEQELAQKILNQLEKVQRSDHASNWIDSRRPHSPLVTQLYSQRKSLPIFEMSNMLMDKITQHPVIIVVGDTGSGKSTQIPQFILESGSKAKIVVTQPRRISAISLADRVATERSEYVGQSVGYQVRFQAALPNANDSILYCTTGMLLQYMTGDALLTSFTHVIVDEVHERDAMTDFLLVLLKRIIPHRPHFRVVLMSATMTPEIFQWYFSDMNCSTIHVPGRSFPVDRFYLEDFKSKLSQSTQEKSFRNSKKNGDITDYALVAELISHLHTHKPPGAILVFLSGWDAINALANELSKTLGCTIDKNPTGSSINVQSNIWLLVLHSRISPTFQHMVFESPPPGVRKIILATNIAETSITVEDIVYVIDTGRIKINRFDHQYKMQVLEECWIAQSNAIQRAGRAGRVSAGECYHVYSQETAQRFLPTHPPELHRMALENVCLLVKSMHLGDIADVLSRTPEPPCLDFINEAIKRLHRIGALVSRETHENMQLQTNGQTSDILTPLGRVLSQLPVDVMFGKMLVCGSWMGCLDEMASVISCIGSKSPFVFPFESKDKALEAHASLADGSESDHVSYWKAIEKWNEAVVAKTDREFAEENFLSLSAMSMSVDVKQQLIDILVHYGVGKIPESSIALSPDKEVESKGEEEKNNIQHRGKASELISNKEVKLLSALTLSLYPNIFYSSARIAVS